MSRCLVQSIKRQTIFVCCIGASQSSQPKRTVQRALSKVSTTVENALNQSTVDGEEYEESGDSPITPMELLKLRSRLIGLNDIRDLQLYVIILFSIKLFLRSNKASRTDSKTHNATGLSDQNWVSDLHIISPEGVIKALGIKIKGLSLFKDS